MLAIHLFESSLFGGHLLPDYNVAFVLLMILVFTSFACNQVQQTPAGQPGLEVAGQDFCIAAKSIVSSVLECTFSEKESSERKKPNILNFPLKAASKRKQPPCALQPVKTRKIQNIWLFAFGAFFL